MDDELRSFLEQFSQRINARLDGIDSRLDALQEQISDTETRLLRAFADYHTAWENRFKRIEGSDATIVERLSALENRLFRLENPEARS